MMVASSSGRSPCTLWPAPSTPMTFADGWRRSSSATSSSSTTDQARPRTSKTGTPSRETASQRSGELGVRAGARGLGAEAGVAPDPAAVLALDRVVQDAASQRGLGPARIVLDGAREQVIEAVEAGGAVDEVGDRRRLLRVDAGRDVDEHERTHELGRMVGQSQRRDAAERHPDDATRVGRQLGDHGGEVAPVGGGRDGAVGPAVGVAVAGQVDGEERAAERERDGVPGVRVLRAAVHQHQLGLPGAGAPEQAGHRAAGVHLDLDALDVGRAVIGDAVFGGVLVEQAELVVGNQPRHATSVPYARRASRRAKNAAMPERRLSAVVLAAGEGTRMRSERPKPLHLLCGRPMVLHVLDAMAEIDVRRVVVVVGHRGEWVTKTLVQHAPSSMQIEFVEQLTRTGTGDALAVGPDRPPRRR